MSIRLRGRTPGVRSDGWHNVLSQMASRRFQRIRPEEQLDWESLKILYTDDWLARRVVETYPKDALKLDPIVKPSTGEGQFDTAELLKRFRTIDAARYPEGAFFHSICQGRLLGGFALLIGARATGPGADPIDPLTIGPSSELAWLEGIETQWLQVISRVTDANSPRLGWPELYRVSGGRRHGLILHESRVIFCEGLVEASQSLTGTIGSTEHLFQNWERWTSVLAPVKKQLALYGFSWDAVSQLLNEASIGVMKMKGLADMIAAENERLVRARMQMITEGRSIAKTVFLDADGEEDYSRTEVQFRDIPDLMDRFVTLIAGACDIPATRLMGKSPDGMNATGESDMRQYYDKVERYQAESIRPKLERVLSIVARQPVSISFKKLWQPTLKEQGEMFQRQAVGDKAYIDAGVLTPKQVTLSRAQDGSLGVSVPPEQIAALALTPDTDRPITVTPSQAGLVIFANELRKSLGLPEEAELNGKTLAMLEAEANSRGIPKGAEESPTIPMDHTPPPGTARHFPPDVAAGLPPR